MNKKGTIIIMNFIISLFLGFLPEILYFILFTFYFKNIKEKRIFFGLFFGIFYILLMFIFKYTVYFNISLTIMFFLILKLIYKDKTHIIDLFIFTVSGIFLTIVSAGLSYLSLVFGHYLLFVLLNRLIIFSCLFLFKNKLNKIYLKYIKAWNIGGSTKIKSITLRNVSMLLFCLSVYAIYIGLIYFLK